MATPLLFPWFGLQVTVRRASDVLIGYGILLTRVLIMARAMGERKEVANLAMLSTLKGQTGNLEVTL
jgi:hypothetical protein